MTDTTKEFPAPTVPSIALAIPANGPVTVQFARDLAGLMVYMTREFPEIRVRMLICEGTLVHEARHKLVRAALAIEDTTHILWLDSDMRFPPDVIMRLLAHNQAVVGTNYATRKEPHIPTAALNDEDDLVFDRDDLPELMEVHRCGMGCMLVEANVYRALPAPWFAIGFNKDADGYAGEDVYFCLKVQDAGLKVHIDTQLSRELGHTGTQDFTLEHAEYTRLAFLTKHPELAERFKEAGRIPSKIVLNGT